MPQLPPWHLWGDSQIIECPYTGLFSTTTVTGQLNRIAYGRPESWHFLFSARVIETTLAVQNPTIGQQLTVTFNLTVGLGRSATTIQAFEEYVFSVPLHERLDGHDCYSTSVVAPVRSSLVTNPNIIERIVAQDIQVNVQAVYNTAETHGDVARLEIGSYFCPISHIRPEWYRGEFPGGEDHGQ